MLVTLRGLSLAGNYKLSRRPSLQGGFHLFVALSWSKAGSHFRTRFSDFLTSVFYLTDMPVPQTQKEMKISAEA
jgi:hypothetical protein